MIKRITILLLIICPTIVTAQLSSHMGAPKFKPETGKRLLIIGQDLGAVGGLSTHADGYIDHLEHVPAGVTTYTGFPGAAGLNSLTNYGAGDIHAQAYANSSKFDNTTIAIGLHIVGQLPSIVNGYSDNEINTLGTWIKNQNRPVFLRIGYEFDGSWNAYNPDFFKRAWIYIVKYFDAMDIRNVAYVWQSAGINDTDIKQWYPGDEYVNWVGYSHFDGPNMGQTMHAFAEEHDKPIMICEATPRRNLSAGNGVTHWQVWFAPLFNTIYGNDRIQALAYINANWNIQSMWQGQGWGDSRVEVNSHVKQEWINEINKDTWMLASDTLFEHLQYQTWMDSIPTIIMDVRPEEVSNLFQVDVEGDYIRIGTQENKLLHGIRLLDIMGREIALDESSKHEYKISVERVKNSQLIIVQARSDHRWMQKKVMITVR
jgi:hypothetical protein